MFSKAVLASIVASVKAQEAINSAALESDDKQFFFGALGRNPAIMANPFVRRFPLPTMHVGNNLKSISNPIAARALADRWLLAYNRGTKQAFTQLLAPNAVVEDDTYTNQWYNSGGATGDFTQFPNNLVRGVKNVSYYFDLLTCLTRTDIEWDSYDTGSGFNPCYGDCGGEWTDNACADDNEELYGDSGCNFECGSIFRTGIWDDCGMRFDGTFVETSFTAYNSGFWQELKYAPSQDVLDTGCASHYTEANLAVNVQVDLYGRAIKYTSYSSWLGDSRNGAVTAWYSHYDD